MKTISSLDINSLFEKANNSSRLRTHLNLHRNYDEKIQRLLIALVQGSFVEPHYHELSHQWEMFTVLQGIVEVKLFSLNGEFKQKILLGSEQESMMIQIEPNEVHSVTCISEKALMLEIKEGPFIPEQAKCFL